MISVDYIRECFNADPETGVLTWRADRPASHFASDQKARRYQALLSGRLSGNAGTVNRNGYRIVGVNYGGKVFKLSAHRIVWALHTGDWPKLHIDHINRVRTDNRISNLRDVSHAVNMQNRAPSKDGSAGSTGVRQRKGGRYAAYINNGGRQRHLGVFDTEAQAHAAYLAEAARVYGETSDRATDAGRAALAKGGAQ